MNPDSTSKKNGLKTPAGGVQPAEGGNESLPSTGQGQNPDDLLNIVNSIRKNTLAGSLGIVFTKLSPDLAIGTMPVDERTIQPAGILHGGASVALAETLASVAATLNAGEGKIAVGVEINANHLRMARKGSTVTGTATPVHKGSKTSVWEIKICDQTGRLICISRMTALYVDRPESA